MTKASGAHLLLVESAADWPIPHAALSEHPPASTESGTSVDAQGDRAAMFNAVRLRLREAVGDHLDEDSAPTSPALVNKVRLAVLECTQRSAS